MILNPANGSVCVIKRGMPCRRDLVASHEVFGEGFTALQLCRTLMRPEDSQLSIGKRIDDACH